MNAPTHPIIMTDMLTGPALNRFMAALDRPAPVDGIAPQGIHWALCLPEAPMSALGPDGHRAVGDDLPEVRNLPRRMWAGSDVRFLAPITVGTVVERRSSIKEIKERSGKSGALVFVTWEHETWGDGAPCVVEEQHLVYRAPAAPGTPAAPPPPPATDDDWAWRHHLTPSRPLLFRFSALTFNTHRIHYDQPYAREEEGYPDLVVHGPLLATLLVDLAQSELGLNSLASFSFRAVAPAFVDQPLQLLGRREGDKLELRVRGVGGYGHVTATATVRN